MLSGIREILLITTPVDQSNFQRLLCDGKHLGLSLQYAIQPSPNGLAQAFLIREEFVGSEAAGLVLGDIIFYGHGFSELLRHFTLTNKGASVIGY